MADDERALKLQEGRRKLARCVRLMCVVHFSRAGVRCQRNGKVLVYCLPTLHMWPVSAHAASRCVGGC